MNVLLHQLQEIVPAFNVASVPRDATGSYASPVHIIAGMLDKTPSYIQKIINGICVNVDANCTKMKVIVNGTEQRNRIMVGDAESILRILASCNRQDMAAIVAKLPIVASASQAPSVAEAPHAPSVAPTPQAPFVAEAPQVPVAPTPQAPSFAPAPQAPDDAMDVDGVSTNDLQNDDDITIQDHFDFVPAQMVEFVLELNGSKFNIPVRRDGYVNVTKICQAAGNGKRLDNYRASPAGKEYMEFLKKRNLAKSNTLNPGITLLTSIRGNCPSRGTFAHPDLAMAIAMWAHPPFLAEVTSWIQELRIENAQLVTQIEELQAAAVDAPPAIVVVDAPPAIAIDGARKPLVLNGITIEVDPQTLMVNATQMCRAAGKLFGNYRRLDSTEDFLQELSSNIHICIFELVKCKPGHNGGTWVDWRVALHLAQWLSPAVQVQVTGWLGEFLLTGRVELGNEMSSQQLDDEWQQRVQEEQARHQQATETLEMRHRQATEALETRITIMERQEELAEQKTREELDAAIKTLARDTEQLPKFPDGANILYAGYIGNLLIKYGQSSNLIRRLAEHRRHYPEFMLIKALPCDNAVASEKKLRDFVAKKRIGGNYNNEKEIICFETQEDVYKLIGAMQRSCRNRSSDNTVELKRIEAEVEIKRIEAEVEVKRMEIDEKKIEMCGKRMELLMQNKITFEQYLQMK